MSVKEMVEKKVAGKKVMVFSQTLCPYCTKAKRALQKYIGNILAEDDYEVMELDSNPDCNVIQAVLRKMTGASSMPRVFINGKCIGGGDETVALDQRGELKKMLT